MIIKRNLTPAEEKSYREEWNNLDEWQKELVLILLNNIIKEKQDSVSDNVRTLRQFQADNLADNVYEKLKEDILAFRLAAKLLGYDLTLPPL